jgi:type IV fimbrial biogenesis protein FimT
MKNFRQAGFTLVELMFSILVLAVLLGIGVPNFRDFLRNSRMASETNDLISGINLARSESIKRRGPVTLCSGTAAGCVAGGDFSDGWVVFVDENADGALGNTEDVLRVHPSLPGGVVTSVVETTDAEDESDPDYDTSADSYVSFGQNGFRRMNDGTMPVALAVVICDERGNVGSNAGPDVSTARAVEISTTGRAAVSRDVERIEALGDCGS